MEQLIKIEDHFEIGKLPGRFWGYGYLRPRTEKLVAHRLQTGKTAYYLPLMPKARMHHSTKIVTQMPMIPGYIFLCLSDDERYDWKRNCEQFIQIELMRDDADEDRLIDELKLLHRCEALAQENPVLINPGIQCGDRVEITAGPLKGLVTEVICRHDRSNAIVVNLTILNRNIEYAVSAEMLKKITA